MCEQHNDSSTSFYKDHWIHNYKSLFARFVSKDKIKMTKFEVSKHTLVPKHSKLNEKDKKELLEKYKVSTKDLPKIRKKDPAIQHLGVKVGDVVKVTRKSPVAGEAVFYRSVV